MRKHAASGRDPDTRPTLEGNMLALDDDFWFELLERIASGTVVPIVGQDLLTVPGGSGTTTVQRRIAARLASELGVAPHRLPPSYSIGDVLYALDRFRERRQGIYTRINAALNDLKPEIPIPLLQLAEIRPFRLFVSTTFDTLLHQALDRVRYGGRPETQRLAYSLNEDKVVDFRGFSDPETDTVVFQLMGTVSALPFFAACDEDLLEYMHRLQSADRQPKNLLGELRRRHLLLLGNNFPDWLGRFFLRLVKAERLWSPRDLTQVVADAEIRGNPNLASFVDRFSCETTVYRDGDAVEFVSELHRRWMLRQPPAASGGSKPEVNEESLSRSVFISYSREDQEAVLHLKRSLESDGLEVWCDLDAGAIPPGTDWDLRIRQAVRRCAVFVPVVSSNTDADLDSYYRREWYWAVDRLPSFAAERSFIFPVALDGHRPVSERKVPDPFQKSQWTVAPSGVPPRELARGLLETIRNLRRRGGPVP